MKINIIHVLWIGGAIFMGGFALGQYDVRHTLRMAAEDISSKPTNTFSRCLTEGWEATGELDPAWKGSKKWVLQKENGH